VHEGEHLFAVERMVVSPAAGLFQKISSVTNKSRIEVGQIIGHVAETEVRSPFSGVLQNFIAVDGERVTAHQPIAWLRTH
jgi:[acyl-carrier-protein] S-malonyltransferase